MKKFQQSTFFVFSILFLMLLVTCKKNEEIKPTPFIDILPGNWSIDKYFTINGVLDSLNEIDKNTIVSILENIDFQYNSAWSEERFHLWSNGGSDRKIFKISNDLGLVSISEDENTFKNLSRFFTYFSNNIGQVDFYLPVPYVSQKKIYNSNNYGIEAITTVCDEYIECGEIENLDLKDIEYFYFKGANSTIGENFSNDDIRFTITNLTTSSFDLNIMLPLYGRTIDGHVVRDSSIFHLKRINTSSTVSIPPFNPNDYQISKWYNFDTNMNFAYYGSCAIVNNGVDKKSCYISGNANSYLIDYNDELKLRKNATTSFWINPTSVVKPKQIIISKYKNQYGPFILSVENNKFIIELNNGNGSLTKYSSNHIISANDWNHIAITVNDSNYASLFINGEFDANFQFENLGYNSNSTTMLGITEELKNMNDWTDAYAGQIDEFIVFDKILTPFEVTQLYLWHYSN